MKPLAYTWPYPLLFWGVFLFAYVPEFGVVARSKPAKGEKTDRGSLQVILLAGMVGSFVAFAVAPISAFVIVRGQKIWFAVGLLILFSGSLLRRHCWRMLGQYFTGDVKAAADQPVIERGAYRWVRHPSYTGGILMYIGTGIALTNWLSAVIIGASGAGAYLYRVHVEEQALQMHIGERYEEYMRRTKRFVPFVY
ncbi:MAG TPA: isoprenylcysteine carboxylmethyltransferase family protein [Candidatus Aquilonibacter sp.]|nr:isoprenylcysteine carboxylmethyltransferase family protein [Candidatus Aquilonibacter sp.]